MKFRYFAFSCFIKFRLQTDSFLGVKPIIPVDDFAGHLIAKRANVNLCGKAKIRICYFHHDMEYRFILEDLFYRLSGC